MKRTFSASRTLAVVLLSFSSLAASAQDDNWWRKLFRKDTVDEQSLPATSPVVTPEVAAPALPPEEFPKGHDTLKTTGTEGLVVRNEPQLLAVLDSLYRENPPELNGFRIQVFFGSLQQAREVRKTFMEVNQETPCYLIQNPPSFAVQIGNYRTQLDAHREAREYKAVYQSAIVVPARIETPQRKTGGKL